VRNNYGRIRNIFVKKRCENDYLYKLKTMTRFLATTVTKM